MTDQESIRNYAPSREESMSSANDWLRAKVGHLTNEQARLKAELQQSKIWTQLYMWTAAIGWSCLVVYSAFGECLCTGS